jgi:hypothetical protein
MTRDTYKNKRLVSVFLLGCLMFNYPILSIFDLPRLVLGIPLLYLYILCAWALLIFLVGLITSKHIKVSSTQNDRTPG